MRCHQHFPRTEVKVKEEITDSEVGGLPVNETADKNEEAQLLGNKLKIQDHLLYETMTENDKEAAVPLKPVKEEPIDMNVTSISLLDIHGFGKRPEAIQQGSANPSETSDPRDIQKVFLFNHDISATDFLLNLSGNALFLI